MIQPDDAPNLLFNQSLEKGLAVLGAFNAQRRTMTIAEEFRRYPPEQLCSTSVAFAARKGDGKGNGQG